MPFFYSIFPFTFHAFGFVMPQARKNPQQYVAIGQSQVKKRMFHDRQQFLLSNTRSLGSDMGKKCQKCF